MNEENDAARPGPEPGSYRIGNVDEPVFQTKTGRQMLAQCLYAVFLGGVMTRGKERHPRLARQMYLLLGDFPADVGIRAQLNRFLEKPLRRAGAPGDFPDLNRGIANHQRFTAQAMFDVRGEGIVTAADILSAARPGARRDTVENYLKRLQDLEKIATGFEGVKTAYALSAGREIRIFVVPEKIDDFGALQLAKDVASKIQSEMKYPGEIKVNVIRETRAVEYAK